jgi:hypothetical protein
VRSFRWERRRRWTDGRGDLVAVVVHDLHLTRPLAGRHGDDGRKWRIALLIGIERD